MKRLTWFWVSAVMLLCSACCVSAENTQGLSWGVEEGQKLDYRYSRGKLNVQIYMLVGSLPEIPDTVSSFTLSAGASFYNTSGSSFGVAIPVSIHYVLPVGNWDLINTLAEDALADDEYSSVQMINEVLDWGYTVSDMGPGYRIEFTVEYNKNDGAISSVEYEKMDLDTADIIESLSISRGGVIDLGVWGPVILYGALGILIVLYCWCKKPSSK